MHLREDLRGYVADINRYVYVCVCGRHYVVDINRCCGNNYVVDINRCCGNHYVVDIDRCCGNHYVVDIV